MRLPHVPILVLVCVPCEPWLMFSSRFDRSSGDPHFLTHVKPAHLRLAGVAGISRERDREPAACDRRAAIVAYELGRHPPQRAVSHHPLHATSSCAFPLPLHLTPADCAHPQAPTRAVPRGPQPRPLRVQGRAAEEEPQTARRKSPRPKAREGGMPRQTSRSRRPECRAWQAPPRQKWAQTAQMIWQ